MPIETPGTAPATTGDDEAVATRSRARPPRLDEALEALPDHCIELLLGEYDLELGEERSVLLVGVEIAHLPASTATIASMADRSSAGRRVDDSLSPRQSSAPRLDLPRFRRHLDASGREPGKVRFRCLELGRRIPRSFAGRRSV